MKEDNTIKALNLINDDFFSDIQNEIIPLSSKWCATDSTFVKNNREYISILLKEDIIKIVKHHNIAWYVLSKKGKQLYEFMQL